MIGGARFLERVTSRELRKASRFANSVPAVELGVQFYAGAFSLGGATRRTDGGAEQATPSSLRRRRTTLLLLDCQSGRSASSIRLRV